MSIADNLREIKNSLPAHVKLVAISKFHPSQAIQELYDAGHRIFGESRMQEIDSKYKKLPKDIEWHFVGHLQRNKVRDIVPYIHTIHSIDSQRLLKEVDRRTTEAEKEVRCFLQLHIAEEDTKYGFSIEECRTFLAEGEWKNYKYTYLGGLMGMATLTDDTNKTRREFKILKEFYEEIKNEYFAKDDRFSEISIGMSDDYQIAVEEGSTMIRVGTSIFGEREY